MRLAQAFAFLLLAACQSAPTPAQQQGTAATLGQEPANIAYRVVETLPHDPEAFTQGLFFADGQLYETTGLVGRSQLRRLNLADGRVLQSVPIDRRMFGEGSTNWGDEILSITWQDGTGFRWNRQTFAQTGTFRYPGEGWGLTQNGTDIIMSDGTAQLRFMDPATMQERRRITVTDRGRQIDRLNELEFVDGQILANVWMTSRIARIDPASGNVTGWIDLTDLANRTVRGNYDAVLNGIAYDQATRRLYVTGKNWPSLYRIELTP